MENNINSNQNMGTASRLRDSFSSSCSSDDEFSINSDNDDTTISSKSSMCRESDIHDDPKLNQRQNIILKLLNRERNGYFSENPSLKIKQNAFNEVPNRLSVCLREIVPYCFLKGHMFLGLTACGKFLLSYKAVCNNSDMTEHNYDFSNSYKFRYELFFWIYRPHNLLTKYYKVCLFDDHGVHCMDTVILTQWSSTQNTLVVHGTSELDYDDSYLTIVSVPKLGCLDCKKLRDEFYTDLDGGSRSAVLCIRCNLTIHVKYSRSESDPVFDPKINFNCPERILIFSDGLIHTINVQLELNKQQKSCSTTLDINYMNRRDRMTLILDCNQMTTDDKLTTKTSTDANATNDDKKLMMDEPKQGTSNSSSSAAGHFDKENIVARIIADFAECETDIPNVEKYQRPQQSHNSGECSNSKGQFDELVISCGNSATTKNNSTAGSSGGRVRLISHRSHRLLARSVNTTKSTIKTVDLQSCSSSAASTSANGNTKNNLDKAAKAYEFSEDTEKCEKISIFRKRRLADKKYEFSEDNLENIIPFTKLRSTRLTQQTFPLRSQRSARPSSMSPSPHTNAVFSSMAAASNYDVPAHTHRASPSFGFRSPCGSPVGNRFLMSPPGRTSSNLYGKSPTYTKPFSSPRNISKQRTLSYLDQLETCSNPLLSPRSDDFEMHKIQPLSEVKPSNNIEASSVVVLPSAEKFDADKPNCSKKLIRRYVEEDDATSVITSEEDDCISPGYHTSLPVEVHGACYSNMQMVSHTGHQQLKCPSVVITQQTFDLEILAYHITNYLCTKSNKKCGFFNDWAYAPVNICPLSCTLTCVLIVNLAAKELKSPAQKQCVNCANSPQTDCLIHRRHYECTALFSWNIETGDWELLNYSDLIEIPAAKNVQKYSGELSGIVKRMAQEFASGLNNRDIFNELRVLDSYTGKSKEKLSDLDNAIEFYRTTKNQQSSADEFPGFDYESH